MNNETLHPLLQRQLRKAGVADLSSAPAAWGAALVHINAFYTQSEQDRYLLERSLDLTSLEMQELNRRIAGERDRLEADLGKVAAIQRAIFPPDVGLRGLEVASRSLPLERVSGDYFDAQPTDEGGWLGIGDVAGHGLTAGMLAIMLQSVVAALIKRASSSTPADLVATVNAVMFENVRGRLELDDHATLTLLHYEGATGVVEYAGAHEDILWWHARERRCETLGTPGTWTALARSIEGVTVNSRFQLADGDLVVLYTDGIVVALGRDGERFGLERLRHGLADAVSRYQDVALICEGLVRSVLEFQTTPTDDATLIVLRRAPMTGGMFREY
jgi:serine phosphatase RsbU (regulator of sigma subunit)